MQFDRGESLLNTRTILTIRQNSECPQIAAGWNSNDTLLSSPHWFPSHTTWPLTWLPKLISSGVVDRHFLSPIYLPLQFPSVGSALSYPLHQASKHVDYICYVWWEFSLIGRGSVCPRKVDHRNMESSLILHQIIVPFWVIYINEVTIMSNVKINWQSLARISGRDLS